MSTIKYEEPYMNALYHYLAEIYVISEKDLTDKEEKIKNYIDKIKAKYNNGKYDINKINDLIKLIEEDDNLDKFKENLKILLSSFH